MKIISLAVAVLLSAGISAQTIGKEVIELKSGEQIIGTVVEQKPGAYIKVLLMPSEDTVTIPLKDIDRMIKKVETEDNEPQDTISEIITPEIEDETIEKPFNGRPFYFGASYVTGGGDMPFLGFGVSVMRTFNDKLQLGLGIEGHTNNSRGGYIFTGTTPKRNVMGSYLPIVGKVRYAYQHLWNGRFSFLAQLSAGYSVVLDGGHQDANRDADLKGGLYVEPSLGFRLNISKDFGTIFSIGYQNLRSQSYYSFTDQNIRSYNWSNITVRAALFF